MIKFCFYLLTIAILFTWACSEPISGDVLPVDLVPVDSIAVVDTVGPIDTSAQRSVYCEGLQPWKFTPGDTSVGVLYGIRSDSFCWIGSGRGGYLDQHPAGPEAFLQLSFETYEFNQYLTESVVFTNIAPRLCVTQSLILRVPRALDSIPEAAMYTLRSDGDVLEDVYELNPNHSSFIRLETYDSTTQTYAGAAEVHFSLIQGRSHMNLRNPDSLSLKEIRFRFRVQ